MIRTEGFRKYFKSFSWLFLDRIVRLLLVMVTGIFVTRYLGAEQFGQLNYAVAIVSIAFMLTAMGLNGIIVRDLVQHPERRDELLGTAFALKLFGSVLLNVVVLVFALIKDLNAMTVILIMITAAAEVFKPMTVTEYFFLSRVQGRIVAQVNIAQSVIGSGFKLALVAMKAPLIWFAWFYAFECLVYAIGLYIAYRHQGLHIRAWRWSKRMAGYLLRQSWPLVIYGIALHIQLKIDQVMIFDVLKKTIGEDAANVEVGQYSVALKMVEALGFLPVIIQTSLAPAISRARVQDPPLYRKRLVNQYRLMFLLFLTTSLPLYFIAEPLIVGLYGEDFRYAGHLLALFAMRLVFPFMGVAKTSFITNESLFKFSLLTAIVGASVNIGMNFLLIPTMRSNGALWATMISFIVSIFLMDLLFKKTRENFRMMFEAVFTFWKIKGSGEAITVPSNRDAS
jgi:O-antigen/teichoic acid export membrane protein